MFTQLGIGVIVHRREGAMEGFLSLERWDCVCILESSFPTGRRRQWRDCCV
jgi:hypothetical protein